MNFAGAMNAGHETQLDVAGLARPGDEHQARRQVRRGDAAKQVEEVRQQFARSATTTWTCGNRLTDRGSSGRASSTTEPVSAIR